MSNEVWIYTMNQGGKIGRWSHYRFPWTIEHFAHLKDTLYMRHADTVEKAVEHEQFDDGATWDAVIQWPWLDFGSPGRNKLMMGFDNVGDGIASIEIGYNQANLSAFTTAFDIPADTEPGQIIPMPITAPTFSVKLTYQSDQAWEWMALQVYIEEMDVGK